jgi:hypothetical protein
MLAEKGFGSELRENQNKSELVDKREKQKYAELSIKIIQPDP